MTSSVSSIGRRRMQSATDPTSGAAVLTVARLTFQEARQRRVLLAVVLFGVLSLILFAIGFTLIHHRSKFTIVGERSEVTNFLLLTGLYGINFLVVMLAVLTSVDTIAGEISSGTIQTIVTKPLRRWQVVIGKWLGLGAMLSVFAVSMSAVMMAIVWSVTRYLPPNPVQGVALMVLQGLILLTLSILGGTRLSTLNNGVVVFMIYGLAFIAGWIEQIGGFIRSEAAVTTGIIVSLVMPSEAMWKRAAYLMQPPIMRQLGFGPFMAMSAPSNVMVAYAGAYLIVALALAVRSFNRRDL